ncbi:hypothetical protein [Nesterenkonia pannonica]|uniref:hypothetical protein n=1 Tax=Nesterenkonia pannonica TaxID=1548602 RepID=UPI002164BD8B|nr:hypothetical protein [Nesterenkonia pannonica]
MDFFSADLMPLLTQWWPGGGEANPRTCGQGWRRRTSPRHRLLPLHRPHGRPRRAGHP